MTKSHSPNAYDVHTGRAADNMRTLSDSSVRLVLTDPPYQVARFMRQRAHPTNHQALTAHPDIQTQQWDDVDDQEWEQDLADTLQQTHRVLMDGGTLILFATSRNTQTIIRLAQQAGLYYKTTGVWVKTNPMPLNMQIQPVPAHEEWIYMTRGNRSTPYHNQGQLVTDVWECPLPDNRERNQGKHPAQKPVRLLQRFIRLFTNPDDLIADPYCGSGSTGVAALREHRRAWLNDLDPHWCDVTRQRCQTEWNTPTLI